MVDRNDKTAGKDGPVRSIEEFIEKIQGVRISWTKSKGYTGECWYRGVRDQTFELVPGAYWHQNCDEARLANTFRQLAPAYLAREPIDDWEWYFLMQHYGLPTRLLDWSESPLVALYFALDGAQAGQQPVVWIMDPGALNTISIGPEDAGSIVPGGDFTHHWLPTDGYQRFARTFGFRGSKFNNRDPIAIMPKRREQRIVAQQGMFTVHGSRKLCLTKIFGGEKRLSTRLKPIPIAPHSVEPLRKQLQALGIFQATLFPELSSVVMDIKRTFDVRRPDPGPTEARAITTSDDLGPPPVSATRSSHSRVALGVAKVSKGTGALQPRLHRQRFEPKQGRK